MKEIQKGGICEKGHVCILIPQSLRHRFESAGQLTERFRANFRPQALANISSHVQIRRTGQ